MSGEFGVFARAIQARRWKMVRRMFGKWTYGLTHRTCRQCGGHKDLNLHSNCYSCMWNNLRRVIFEEEDE